MRLEDEIKTKGFRNELHKLSVNLIYTTNWLVNIMQSQFQEYGVTMQQFNILRILRGQHPVPCTIQLLKERMLDKQSDASRLVDRLCSKALVVRTVSDHDRRKMDVVITDAGLELLQQMEVTISASDALFDGVSNAEAEIANNVLDRIRENVPAAHHGTCGD